MASNDAWSDFESIRHNVKHNTVDRLKHIIASFNDQCGTSFTKTGKKQELIDRITRELDLWKRTNNVTKWQLAKDVLGQSRLHASPSTSIYSAASSPVNHYTPSSSTGAFHARAPGSNLPPFDPYAPPRRPTQSTSVPGPSSSSSPAPGIHFKPSPFFRVEKQVSPIIECPESYSQADRKQQVMTFTLSPDVIAKLTSANHTYQLRLYCTSSTFYTPASAFRPSNGPCPIEFPPTCEIRVNHEAISANVKGMKKKPGTAPPPDLGRGVRLDTAPNKVELIYVNSQQPVLSKKYYMVVMLVETTTVDQLVDRLRKGKYRSSADIVAKMKQAAAIDDDIVAGHQKMSLKCPLSYMRISTPCRSAHCVHSQCFDAMSWFSVMEQTTTWLCPVCEKVLNADDLIVDGFFDEILRETHEDVEDIIVEADGEWHTTDNKFGSSTWKAAHPVKDPTPLPPTPIKKRSPSPVTLSALGDALPKKEPTEIVILDSDDEDEGQVKRELSVHRPLHSSLGSFSSQPPRSQTAESDVIDLTLDSDDETAVEPTNSRKRKSVDRDISSPTEQIWKKSRVEASHPTAVSPLPPAPTPAAYTNGSSYPSHSSRRLPPPSPTNHYATNYPARPPPPHFPGSSYIPPGGAPLPPRPTYSTSPPTYLPPPRTGGGSSSSTSWRI